MNLTKNKLWIPLCALILLIALLIGVFAFKKDNDYYGFSPEKYVKIPKEYQSLISYGNLDSYLENNVSAAQESLLNNYSGNIPKTEGTLKKGDTVYIHYKGKAVLIDCEVTFTVGKSGFDLFDERLIDSFSFGDQRSQFKIKASEDLKLPNFVSQDVIIYYQNYASKFFQEQDTTVVFTLDQQKHNRLSRISKGDTLTGHLLWYASDIYGMNSADNIQDPYKLELGSGTMIGGFEEDLIGKFYEPGKVYAVDLTFPTNYHANKKLQGIKAHWDVTLVSAEHTVKFDPHTQWAELKKEVLKEHPGFHYDSLDDFLEDARMYYAEHFAVSLLMNNSDIPNYSYTLPEGAPFERYRQRYELLQKAYSSTPEAGADARSISFSGAASQFYKDLALYQVAQQEGLDDVSKRVSRTVVYKEDYFRGYRIALGEQADNTVEIPREVLVHQFILQRARTFLAQKLIAQS